jgi:hypothetical protein
MAFLDCSQPSHMEAKWLPAKSVQNGTVGKKKPHGGPQGWRSQDERGDGSPRRKSIRGGLSFPSIEAKGPRRNGTVVLDGRVESVVI